MEAMREFNQVLQGLASKEILLDDKHQKAYERVLKRFKKDYEMKQDYL